MRVLVELSPTIDHLRWQRRHALGEVPDRVPYGLDRLADEGIDVTVRGWSPSPAIARAGNAAARLTAGVRWAESLLTRTDTTDVVARLCWDERIGIPPLLDPRQHLPVVTGIIWATDSGPGAVQLRTLGRAALARAAAVFVSSAGQLASVRNGWRVPSDRLHYVPFGVDTDFWVADQRPDTAPATRAAVPATARRIVAVGNDRHRDHATLVAAMADVRRAVPGGWLDLVTGQPVDLPADVGLRYPFLLHPQLRDLYRQVEVAAIATHPNLHCSGLTATLEAMAMGRAVVATGTPGMEEYVDHGRTGLLVPPGDPQALAAALIDLLRDPAQAAELAANARSRVREEFSTAAQATRLAKILQSAVNG